MGRPRVIVVDWKAWRKANAISRETCGARAFLMARSDNDVAPPKRDKKLSRYFPLGLGPMTRSEVVTSIRALNGGRQRPPCASAVCNATAADNDEWCDVCRQGIARGLGVPPRKDGADEETLPGMGAWIERNRR